MRNGGANDVYQAVMQGLCSLTLFVKHFMVGSYLKGRVTQPRKKPFSDKVEKVIKSLYRDEVDFTPSTANIMHLSKYFKRYHKKKSLCAVYTLNIILEKLIDEQMNTGKLDENNDKE